MPEQCRAVTEDGERCSRAAEEDGFCHQHGPEDETVDETEDADSETDANDEETQMSENADTQTADGETGADDHQSDSRDREDADEGSESDETESGGADSGDGCDASDGEADIVTVRNTVQQDVPDLIARDLDGVTSVIREEDGWMATVEMVERHSIPDTQDILGHYEISMNEDADVVGYRRLDTYRRADGPPFDG